MQRYFILLLTGLFCLPVYADKSSRQVDCDKGQRLQKAIKKMHKGGTVYVRGVCRENLLMRHDNIRIIGLDHAAIHGDGGDTITVEGADNITLANLHIGHGANGLTLLGGASVQLHQSHVGHNQANGIHVINASTLQLADIKVMENGANGINIENSSSAQISGPVEIGGHAVAFGINALNGSSIKLDNTTLATSGNAIGLQVGINSSLFITGDKARLVADHNILVGITATAGSNIFAFNGEISASHNRTLRGISLLSASSMDIDNNSRVDASHNGRDGILLDDSSLNMFGPVGASFGPSLTTSNNAGEGITARNNAVIDLAGESKISSRHNGASGLFLDNGTTASLSKSTLTDNGHHDVRLSFGSRAQLNGNEVNELACDASSFMRGDDAIPCPHHVE